MNCRILMLNCCIVKLLVEKESDWIRFATIQQYNNSSFYSLCSITQHTVIKTLLQFIYTAGLLQYFYLHNSSYAQSPLFCKHRFVSIK
jgi:hypothetical protein